MRKFAWLPKRMSSGRVTWLSYYYEYRSLYDINTGRPPIYGLHFVFTETPKEKTLRLLKESVIQNRNVWNDPILTKEDNRC
jgi:hypothetical protein